MKKKSFLKSIALASTFLLISSFSQINYEKKVPIMNNEAIAAENEVNIDKVLKKLRDKIAPDDRVTLFDIKATNTKGGVILSGKVMDKAQKDQIIKEFEAQGLTVQDNIKTFPFSEVGEMSYGVVNMPVMHIRTEGKHSSELSSQAILGSTMKIIGKQQGKDEWVYVSIDDDKYMGWVRKPDVWIINEKTYNGWRTFDKVILTDPVVNLLNSPDKKDKSGIKLYFTTRLNFIERKGDFYKVKLPGGNKEYSGKEFYVPSTSARYVGKQLSPIPDFKTGIVKKAKSMMSVPYLWGGASPAMTDCSGFTQMLYRYSGYYIPRDADQQQNFAKPIKDRKQLKVGDLVFFSENKKHATHVGMYIGDSKFIHSSVGYGGVAITSFDPKDPLYNPLYIKIYYGAGRIIKE